jgi:hypothetical protein
MESLGNVYFDFQMKNLKSIHDIITQLCIDYHIRTERFGVEHVSFIYVKSSEKNRVERLLQEKNLLNYVISELV